MNPSTFTALTLSAALANESQHPDDVRRAHPLTREEIEEKHKIRAVRKAEHIRKRDQRRKQRR